MVIVLVIFIVYFHCWYLIDGGM